MSIRLMSRVWDMEGLPPHLKLLLLRLADHANDEGRCHPGQSSLSVAVSAAERTVRLQLATLTRLGLVEVAARRRQKSQEYQLHIPTQPDEWDWADLARQLAADPALRFDLNQDRQPTAGLNESTENPDPAVPSDSETGPDRQPAAAHDPSPDMIVITEQDRQPTAGLNESRPATTRHQDRQPSVVKTGNPPPVPKENHQGTIKEPDLASLNREPAEKPIDRQLWDALVEAGYPEPTNDNERGRWNRAIKLLRQSNATPLEVGRRAREFRRRWHNLEYQPPGLASNWTSLGRKPGAPVTAIAQLPDCARCENHRSVGQLPDGTLVAYDDVNARAMVPCPDCRPKQAIA